MFLPAIFLTKEPEKTLLTSNRFLDFAISMVILSILIFIAYNLAISVPILVPRYPELNYFFYVAVNMFLLGAISFYAIKTDPKKNGTNI
jgi:hypothetical protein